VSQADRYNYDLIPPTIMEGLNLYVEHGLRPGGFLTAVLCNDLFGAMAKADEMSARWLPALCTYIYNNVPGLVWGSEGMVEAWIGAKAEERKEMEKENRERRAQADHERS
jgi:hypothetical protein